MKKVKLIYHKFFNGKFPATNTQLTLTRNADFISRRRIATLDKTQYIFPLCTLFPLKLCH